MTRFPDLPRRMLKLPVDTRGFPVPRFVQWFEDGKPRAHGVGAPDFRVIDTSFLAEAVKTRRCWICGDKLGAYLAFNVGPMAALNRISAEPPSHKECAIFAAEHCPFLSRPLAKRREAGLPEHSPAPGIALEHNPQACAVWITRRYDVIRATGAAGGKLLKLGPASDVLWFASGRRATRSEVEDAIRLGLPMLLSLAEGDPDRGVALRDIQKKLLALYELIPRAEATA